MARHLRIQYDGDRKRFLHILLKSLASYTVKLYSYVLMSSHSAGRQQKAPEPMPGASLPDKPDQTRIPGGGIAALPYAIAFPETHTATPHA